MISETTEKIIFDFLESGFFSCFGLLFLCLTKNIAVYLRNVSVFYSFSKELNRSRNIDRKKYKKGE